MIYHAQDRPATSWWPACLVPDAWSLPGPEECLVGRVIGGAVRDQAVPSRMTGCAPETAIERGEPNCVESVHRPPA